MALIIIIKAITRKAVMIMMLMIPVMRKEEEEGVEVGKRSPFQEEGTSKTGFEDREGYKVREEIIPQIGQGQQGG